MKHLGVLLLSALSFQLSAFGQGSLTPPGPPAPTMKTLAQIEPRTAITNLPVTISQPGSYYVTTNLTGNPGGITINANGVTIDLMGFELVGGTGDGIVVSGLRTNIAVRNGTVRGWSGDGVDTSFAGNSQLERLAVSSNSGAGIFVGTGSAVSGCTAQSNTGAGISAFHGSTVSGCTATFNTGDGIEVNIDCRVADNTSDSNGNGGDGAGIHVIGSDNRIEGNNVTDGDWGIKVDAAGNLIVKNSASGNTTNYFFTGTQTFGPTNLVTGEVTDTNPWRNFSY